MEDQDINNFTDTVPADLAHLQSTESNSTERLGICRSGNKRSRYYQLRHWTLWSQFVYDSICTYILF